MALKIKLGPRSIRGRIIAVSLVLVMALIGAAIYTQSLVESSARHNLTLIEQQRDFARELAALKGDLYDTENGVYQYASLLDEKQRKTVITRVDAARQRGTELSQTALARRDPALMARLNTLNGTLKQLDEGANQVLQVIANISDRYPASPILVQTMFPANASFVSAVESAIDETRAQADSPQRDKILELLYEIRLRWAQQIAAVRGYVANRSGVFGTPELGMRQNLRNRDYFMSQLAGDIQQLQVKADKNELSIFMDQFIHEMHQAMVEYDRAFTQVKSIYDSGKWRADIPLFKTRLQPLFTQAWAELGAVESHLHHVGNDTLMRTTGTAGTLSRFLWLITAAAAISLLGGLAVYEYLVRRPVAQVTHALQALGQGDSYSPLLRVRASETDQLLGAFREMQARVYNREMRLSAILDTASEGIITINERGIIETFNSAAERLFGYAIDEAVGRNVSILMPHPMREEHDGYIARYLASGERRVIDNEINVNAQRKDGAVFPMSIKLSEMTLDGHRYFTAIVEDISERKAMMDHLRHLAEHDSLTGLYNRQYFTEELERVVERSIRQGGFDCALLYLDLDNFKYVNDTLGHLAGDRVLVEVTNLLTRRTRRSDVISRLGGDEFAILLYDVNQADALTAAEGYRQQLAEYNFHHEGKMIDVGVSIGVALFTADLESKEELMARADVSCHMAKRAGRNCVHLYQPDDRDRMESMSADMGWARTIKDAIENDNFILALQPIVDATSRKRIKYEALLRMRGDNDEIIMPGGFMGSAERFGLILEVDRWVIRHGIELLSRLQYQEDAGLSINLSAMAVGNSEILRLITEALEEFQVDRTRLTFEITETIAIADLAAASEFLQALRALGCRTALDDFGVGYCSFAYLKDLPVDFVKIDGSFVRDIAHDPLQLAMVKSMHEIAHAMGKRTIAEFVETEAVLAQLQAIGIDYVQGYLTGRPQLVEEAAGKVMAGA